MIAFAIKSIATTNQSLTIKLPRYRLINKRYNKAKALMIKDKLNKALFLI